MRRTIRRAALVTLGVLGLAVWPVRAQLVVHDPAVTLRNSITATLSEYLASVQRDQQQLVRRMAQRLSVWTNLDVYRLTDTPEWRIHDFTTDAVLFALAYHAALNYGDGSGAAYLGVTDPLVDLDAEGVVGRLSPAGWQALRARLATVDVADATAISATNDDGLLRYNGRREQAAIEALEAQVIDPSQEQSTTAVLEKLTGAELIGVRNRQARNQLLADIVEQLLVDTKRARDTDGATINMQLTTWQDAKSANEAFVAGTGDALRTWRQP
jgi:hypothetical protein